MWDGTNWTDHTKIEYTYDANNYKIEEIYYTWDGANWNIMNKFTYAYDANGNEIESIFSTWNNGSWEFLHMITSSYNMNDMITEEIFSNWDGAQWVYDYQSLYTYDANDLLTETLSSFWDGTQWVYDEKCVFLHYDLSVGIDETYISSDAFNIYPNPANDNINIYSTYNVTVQIINTQGQILHIGEYYGHNKIDISTYPEGVYFIKSNFGYTSNVYKIIKH